MTVRTPKTLAAATRLLEQFAQLTGQIGEIEANRQASIADVNARCDTAANDLIAQRAKIHAAIEDWWAVAGAELLPADRKSIELGGCIVGTRLGKPSLATACAPDVIIARLENKAWAKGLLRASVSLDKRAILKALEGPHAAELREAGFSINPPEADFILERAEQGQTRGRATR